jgi:hypothetical protein
MKRADELPRSFPTRRDREIETRPIIVRDDLDRAYVRRVRELLAEPDWNAVYHAYGPASDVPAQLAAVAVGDESTREEAWWNLWGNIHHQGTIYEATVPAVPVLYTLAAWRDHPDRTQALLMLREIAAADGLEVWRYDADGEIVRSRRRERLLFADLRTVLTAATGELAARWRTETDPVRRALVWLLSTVPEVRERYHELIDETLPAHHRRAWDIELAGYAATEEEAAAVYALEAWVEGSGS